MPEPAIGFDFGTSNSAIAVLGAHDAAPRLLHLDRTQPKATFIPTTLYITRDGAPHIGYDAIDTYVRAESGRTIVRRGEATGQVIETSLGRHHVWSDVDANQPGRFFQSLKRSLPDRSFRGTNIFGRFYTMEELIATIMRVMRERAEAELGQLITTATVGRPVHWAENNPASDALALKRMEKALGLAGFATFSFVPEPIAAGLHFAASLPEPRTVFVFDFGGGTLDVTVMRVGGGIHEVLATAGIPLGGNTLDEDIMDGRMLRHFGESVRWGSQQLPMPQHIMDAIRRWYTIPELNEARTVEFLRNLERETVGSEQRQVRALIALARGNRGWSLFQEIERAKISLSAHALERIRYVEEAIDIDESLPRRDFEGLIALRVTQAGRCIDEALAAAGVLPGQIEMVVRTGGSSLIPSFQRLLAKKFGREKLRAQDAFGSVVTGLAYDAGTRTFG
jgi:hypothetical chaperone protein